MSAWSRRVPLAGVVATALMVAAFVVGGETPDTDSSGAEVIEFYVDDEGAQFAGAILAGYAAVFLLVFAGALRAALSAAERPGSKASATAFGGGVLAAAGIAIFSGLGFVLADSADEIEPAAAQTLNVLSGGFFMPLAVGTAVLMLGAGASAIKYGGLPAGLGWTAILIGVCAMTPIGFFALLAMLLWSAVTSVVLYARSGAEATAAA